MFDSKKVIIALIVFLGIVALPFVCGLVSGENGGRPELAKARAGTTCVEDPEYMNHWHMDLLDNWRQEVVRNGNRMYVASDGRKHEMSLSMTCMRCHVDQTQFCDKCHLYAGVDPTCWDCHVEPKR